MCKKRGLLFKCDRCGTSDFAPYIEEHEEGKKATEGTMSYHKGLYKVLEGWDYVPDIGDLCPNCAREYKEMMEYFRRYTKEANT